ncbi:MAG: hypothetical protein AB2L14_31300 [Candidatus Xenobiia bacterium LiM19]
MLTVTAVPHVSAWLAGEASVISSGGIRLEIENLLERLIMCWTIKMTMEVNNE